MEKEAQDELDLGWQDYAARMYSPETGRWLSIDPMADASRRWSPYVFCYNNPLTILDPDGMFGEYYAMSGAYLGSDGINDDKVYAVKDGGVVATKTSPNHTTNVIKTESIQELNITHTDFMAIASLVHNESLGGREETYGIANATMNFLVNGGSTQLKTIADVSLYLNGFSRGAKQDLYSSFLKMSKEDQNSRYAFGAVINAISCNDWNGELLDYSNGTTGWNGIDLVKQGYPNSHRKYIWRTDAKTLLHRLRGKV